MQAESTYPAWIKRLMQRWQLNPKQVVLALIVFTLTGTTVLLIKRPLFNMLGIDLSFTIGTYILYLICILPVYNLLLLGYGSLFGLFNFFWKIEKRMLKRIIGIK